MNCPKCDADVSESYEPDDPSSAPLSRSPQGAQSCFGKLRPNMAATFDYFGFMPPELRKHFAQLEDFVGEIDGKCLGTLTNADTFIDEGTVDAEETVKAINSIATEIKRLLEIPAAAQ